MVVILFRRSARATRADEAKDAAAWAKDSGLEKFSRR
jgi:hypothetical protein